MRVAVVTQHFPNSRQQWVGHSAYQTLRELALRCDLHVFYPEASYPSRLTPAGKRRPPLDRSWSPAGVAATYIPYPLLPLVSRPLNGFVIANRLLPSVRKFQPDIVLNYFIYPDGYAAVRIAKALNVPVVLTAVGSDLNVISDPLCGMLIKSALQQADFVSTVSHALCGVASDLGADPAYIRAKLNGCDTSVFYPRDRREARKTLGIEPDAEAIVYVGRLDVRKGLMELIESVAQLASTHPRLRCYIVGDGPDKSLLTDAIARHNVAAAITLVPSCLTDRVALWMAAADLVTLPSYREGCPNVVIEALASGRPVVATNVGGIPELMDNSSGRLVPPRDVSSLTQALEEVLGQTWDPATISKRHSRSWANVADELYQVLEETLQRKR